MESVVSVELAKDNEVPAASNAQSEAISEQEISDQPPLQEQQQQQQQQPQSPEDVAKSSMKKWQSEGGLDALRKKKVSDATTEIVSSTYGLRKRRSSGVTTRAASVKEEKENTPAKKRSARVAKKEPAGKWVIGEKEDLASAAARTKDGANRRTPGKSSAEANEGQQKGRKKAESPLKDKEGKVKAEDKAEEKGAAFVYTTMDDDDLAVAAELDPNATTPAKVNVIQPEKPAQHEKKAEICAEDGHDDTLTEENADRSE